MRKILAENRGELCVKNLRAMPWAAPIGAVDSKLQTASL